MAREFDLPPLETNNILFMFLVKAHFSSDPMIHDKEDYLHLYIWCLCCISSFSLTAARYVLVLVLSLSFIWLMFVYSTNMYTNSNEPFNQEALELHVPPQFMSLIKTYSGSMHIGSWGELKLLLPLPGILVDFFEPWSSTIHLLWLSWGKGDLWIPCRLQHISEDLYSWHPRT